MWLCARGIPPKLHHSPAQALASRLGSAVSVWNVSLYGGIDLLYQRRDGGCLAAELQAR